MLLIASVLAAINSLYSQEPFRARSIFDTPEDLNLIPSPSPFPNRTAVVSSEPVSVVRLRHKIPRSAEKELEKALSDVKHGRIDSGIQHLQVAVRLDPEYWDAHRHLADLYWKREQRGAALDCLDAALTIDPNSDSLQSNKAIALLALGRPGEAEQAARNAIRLMPSSEDAHYLLAVAQVRQGHPTSETLDHLSIAGRRIDAALELKRKVEVLLASEGVH